MRKSVYMGMALFVIIAGITAGIIVHVYNDKVMEKASMKRTEEDNLVTVNTIIQTATQEEKTTPNTMITVETYYEKCGHNEIEKKKIESEDINKTEKELEEKYAEYKITKFSNEEVKLYREKKQMCENHYVIKEKEGKIAIYNVNENGKETFKTDTEILTKYLPDEDVELLKKGIKASSEAQLNQILSDYE